MKGSVSNNNWYIVDRHTHSEIQHTNKQQNQRYFLLDPLYCIVLYCIIYTHLERAMNIWCFGIKKVYSFDEKLKLVLDSFDLNPIEFFCFFSQP